MEPNKMLWQQDINLLNFHSDEIKLISCDIFDTLVFRTTVEPQDVFLELGREAKEKGFLRTIEPEEFMLIRILAERKAHAKKEMEEGTIECDLREIYDQTLSRFIDKEKLMELELELEKRCSYINPSIESLLHYYHEKGVKIVLLSDMYLSKKQLQALLSIIGFDCSILDDILVSSQYGVSKGNKGLFQVLLNKYPYLSPANITHIGDNYHSDVVNAQSCGIRAIYYNTREETGTPFELERLRRNALIPEIFFLRKLAGYLSAAVEEEYRFWFEFGATIIGPFLSIFTEWVVDNALNEGIKRIYPLMREGAQICKLIQNSLRKRKISDIVVRPLYVSRRSCFLSSFDDINEQVIKGKILAQSWSPLLSGIFTQLKVENVFKQYSNVRLPQAANITLETGKTLLDAITDYLCRPDMIQKIREKAVSEKNLFTQYLVEGYEMDDLPCMTVDIGYNGTIQYIIEQVFRKAGNNCPRTHLLFASKENTLAKVIEGMDIRGFISEPVLGRTFHSNHWTPEIIEWLIAECEGTTVGYQKSANGEVIPILDDIQGLNINRKERETCQQGILAFQELFLELLQRKPWLRETLYAQRKQLFEMSFLRFMKYPTHREAENLGRLNYEDSFRGDIFEPYCPEEYNELARKIGPSAFFEMEKLNVNIWMAGIVEKAFPNYLRMRLLKEETPNSNIVRMLELAELVYQKNINEVTVYGAGELGREMVKILTSLKMKITCIIDRNSSLWGKKIGNVEICSLDQALKTGVETIVIASCAFVEEIRETLKQKCLEKGIQLQIYDYLQAKTSNNFNA